MISPKDLRIGDLVRLSRDCIFPKGTMCTVADIRTEIEHKDKKGVVSLSAINDEDDGPWGTWCCNIEGIPITPEILEKNGFKVRVSRVYYTKLIGYANFLQRNIAIERKRNDWAVFLQRTLLSADGDKQIGYNQHAYVCRQRQYGISGI